MYLHKCACQCMPVCVSVCECVCVLVVYAICSRGTALVRCSHASKAKANAAAAPSTGPEESRVASRVRVVFSLPYLLNTKYTLMDALNCIFRIKIFHVIQPPFVRLPSARSGALANLSDCIARI